MKEVSIVRLREYKSIYKSNNKEGGKYYIFFEKENSEIDFMQYNNIEKRNEVFEAIKNSQYANLIVEENK